MNHNTRILIRMLIASQGGDKEIRKPVTNTETLLAATSPPPPNPLSQRRVQMKKAEGKSHDSLNRGSANFASRSLVEKQCQSGGVNPVIANTWKKSRTHRHSEIDTMKFRVAAHRQIPQQEADQCVFSFDRSLCSWRCSQSQS